MEDTADAITDPSDSPSSDMIINMINVDNFTLSSSNNSDNEEVHADVPIPEVSDSKLEEPSDADYDLSDAEEYFSRQNGIIRCRICGELGHQAKNCPKVGNDTCYLCAETGHLGSSCPSIICRQYSIVFHLKFSCNKQGHTSNDCQEVDILHPCIYCSSHLHRPEVSL